MHEIAIQPITRPELISDQTYESLRQLIINCQLQPGVAFVEADVARRLGISRSPLREAVRRLEEEGFIETLDGRRRVAAITAEKVLELYEFRCVLEKFAADRSEGLISLKDLDRVTSKFDLSQPNSSSVTSSRSTMLISSFISFLSGDAVTRLLSRSWPSWSPNSSV